MTIALLCKSTGEQVDAHEAVCKVPVFRDGWNRWEIRFTTRYGASASDARQRMRAFLTRYLDGGTVRHVTFHDAKPAGWLPLLSRNDLCGGIDYAMSPSEYNQESWALYVEFVYRGLDVSYNWPAHKVIGLVGTPGNAFTQTLRLCPLESDYLLDTVFIPEYENVPEADKDPVQPPYLDPHREAAEGAIDGGKGAIGEVVDEWIDGIKTNLIIVGGVVVVGVWWVTRKR